MVKNRNSEKNTNTGMQPQAEPQVPCAPAAPALGYDASKGAPPSNTAPPNCIYGSSLIRCGVDSLYISHRGSLNEDRDLELRQLKLAAQSFDSEEKASARLQLMDHYFEVKDKGRGRFPFVLADNWFHIQVSSSISNSLPLTQTQISSEVLTRSGIDSSTSKLRGIVQQLGSFEEETISRVDLCVDFLTDFDFSTALRKAWVCRSSKFNSYYEGDRCSGFSFGSGGSISARLYDKSLEINLSRKTWLYEIWMQNGWQGELPVWRLEFQFRRATLREMGMNRISDLKQNLDGLWRYGCSDWLRLAIPSETDDTKSRWQTHPVWEMLTAADFQTEAKFPLKRTRKERVPTDERLFIHGLGGLSSYMAKKGISDVDTAFRCLKEDAEDFHRRYSGGKGTLSKYLVNKASEKARRFNTLMEREKEATATDYRKAKGRR
jgi:hypothetical protein